MRKERIILAIVLAAGMLFSCGKENPNFKDFRPGGEGSTNTRADNERTVSPETRWVHILYSAGYNSLYADLYEDIQDFAQGEIPGNTRNGDVLLVISRLTKDLTRDYNTPNPPVLIRLTREEGQETRMDTLKVWEANKAAASASFMREALEYVKDNFPAAGYGMVFSSHASGWLPSRYYSDPGQFDRSENESAMWSMGKRVFSAMPPIPEYDYPAVKSVGQDQGNPYSEIEIQDLPGAFPMHMNYLVFDACLMGCIEVAYELRNVCDMIAFSQTEVLSDGFDYTSMTSRLLEHNIQGICSDYFEFYNARTGQARSATISLVNCKALDNLADVCATLFAKYRDGLNAVVPGAVQGYFRYGRHYFYDLLDILLHSGINAEEAATLKNAIDASLLYKAATPRFIDFDIYMYSGYSMFLPAACPRADYLNNYYRTSISWNTRTGLLP